MRNLTIIIFGLLIFLSVHGQNEKLLYDEFLERQFGTRYVDKGNFKDKIFEYDFSRLWTVKKLNFSPDIRNPIRPEPLGFIGDNFQRLFIHFNSGKKRNSGNYFVTGKTKVKENICDFKGFMTIKMVQEFEIPYLEGSDYVVDPRKIRQGVLIGEYEFFEDSTQNHGGILKGKFVTNFYFDENNKIEYNTSEIFSDNYINNQFKGIWKSYSTGKQKKANWGDYRVPESQNLDMGAAEFSPLDKYLKFGWESYREAYFSTEQNKEARKIEENEWWNEK
jgi:hypothetical protein